MLLAFGAILVGLALLIWSADKFVDGAVGLAESWGMSKAMIGLTIVSLGTSAPEILVSIMAATEGSPELAFGNAIGSNIANIAMVLGATALIAALPVKQGLLKQDLPALLAVTFIAAFLLRDLELSRNDAAALVGLLVILMYLLFRYKKEHPEEAVSEAEEVVDFELKESIISFILGLVVLVISSKLLVWGAIDIATQLGISQIVIGLTIIAIGTSLPELAASIASARRGHHDIALGNIVGSNILNILAVLSIAALIDPIHIDQEVFFRDYGSMAAITLLLAFFIIMPRTVRRIGRAQGVFLLLCYAAYMTMLYLQST
ncbi:MAG: calcium/sodium antiporter [Moraxellaceae bacterium]|nr:MAG: calcium/sodium antiporter [Moraxellaceae bacterium]